MNRVIEFIVEFIHDEHRLSLLLFFMFFGYIACGALPYIKDLHKKYKEGKENERSKDRT